MKPRISVIIPIYNREKYLQKCVDSVLEQTFEDFELILVDDGSIDSSPKICDEYAAKDNRVRVIHKENGGVSSARNVGIQASFGEYIMFVDSDDYIDKDMLDTVYVCVEEHHIDCVVTGLRFVYDAEGRKKECPLKNGEICFDVSLNDEYDNLKNNFVFSTSCAKLYKTSIIKSNNIRYNENYSILEDGSFVMNCFGYCSSIYTTDRVLYNYRQSEDFSLMNKFNENSLDALQYFSVSQEWLLCHLDNKNKRAYHKGRYDLLINFILQVFNRSQLCDREKRKLFKEYINHSCAKNIANDIRDTEVPFKTKFIALLIKYQCTIILYPLLSFWAKKRQN